MNRYSQPRSTIVVNEKVVYIIFLLHRSKTFRTRVATLGILNIMLGV